MALLGKLQAQLSGTWHLHIQLGAFLAYQLNLNISLATLTIGVYASGRFTIHFHQFPLNTSSGANRTKYIYSQNLSPHVLFLSAAATRLLFLVPTSGVEPDYTLVGMRGRRERARPSDRYKKRR